MKKYIIALFALPTLSLAQTPLTIKPYGFIKASAIGSDKALASYNDINLSAPTFAVARTRDKDENSRTSFQAAQSRIGATITKSEKISGRFEFDFIDFSKSSPTTQMYPRVRRAVVTYTRENDSFDLGQDWDLFAPINPYNFNFIGNYFNAGNSGFMRQQFQYHRNVGDWEVSGAIGMAGNNPGVTDTDLEFSNAPSYSARIMHKGPTKWGASFIYSRLNNSTNDSWHETHGQNLFFEKDTTPWGIKAELFHGQNLANIGALTLAKGTATEDVREWGGFLTGSYVLDESWKLIAGLGVDKIENKTSLSTFALDASGAITRNGVKSNFLSRIAVEHTVEQDFSIFAELSRFETTSKLAVDSYKTVIAHTLDAGILWKF